MDAVNGKWIDTNVFQLNGLLNWKQEVDCLCTPGDSIRDLFIPYIVGGHDSPFEKVT